MVIYWCKYIGFGDHVGLERLQHGTHVFFTRALRAVDYVPLEQENYKSSPRALGKTEAHVNHTL